MSAAGSLVGAAVRKRFGSRWFNGTVTSFDAAVGWYKVSYDDGDSEECDEEELQEWLVGGKAKAPAAVQPTPAAAAAASGRGGRAVKAEVAGDEAPAAVAAPAARTAKAKRESAAPAVPAAAAASGRAVKAEAAAPKRKAKSEDADAAAPAAAPAKTQKKGKKGKAVKPKVKKPEPVATYLPLRTKRSERWRTGKPLGGIAALVGTWHVYAAHHTVAGVECYDAVYAGEALVESSGSLVLSASDDPECLSGMLTAFQIGNAESVDDFGPLVQHATVEVRVPPADTEPEELRGLSGRDCGVFVARVRGYGPPGDRWTESYDDEDRAVEGYPACVDLNGAKDEQVPRLRENTIVVHDDDDDDEDDSDDEEQYDGMPGVGVSANAVAAEKKGCFDSYAPPLLVCKGDLRLDVRYQQRGGHGDAGCGIAYLLRRAAHEGGAAASAAKVGPQSGRAQTWDEYNEFRYRDHF